MHHAKLRLLPCLTTLVYKLKNSHYVKGTPIKQPSSGAVSVVHDNPSAGSHQENVKAKRLTENVPQIQLPCDWRNGTKLFGNRHGWQKKNMF